MKILFIPMEVENGTHKPKYFDQQFKVDEVIPMLASKSIISCDQ